MLDTTGIDFIRQQNGDGFKKGIDTQEIAEKKRQNFKKLTKSEQLKTLFYYMKERTKDNLYKKEGNRVIGEHFGVGKDLIGGLIKTLENTQNIVKLTELQKYYKIMEEFKNVQ